MKRTLPLMAFLCAILFIQCKTQELESNVNNVFLLDSIAASDAISIDDTEHFFEHIRTLDMEIQMKQLLSGTHDQNVKIYKDFLRQDVTDFTEKEVAFVLKTMSKARKLCENISPDIFPDSINLIKTTANHYGKSIFYTRENNIIIPYNELNEDRDDDAFLETMLHEIFHIYSRTNPDKRARLYQLIGFAKKQPIRLPEALDRRLLLNPDGIDIEYLMKAVSDVDTTNLILLLHANALQIKPNDKGFFSYAELGLFEVEKKENMWFVQTTEGYKSTTNEPFQADFQRQIGPNTGYIWHPDEILAENFAFLTLIRGNLLRMKNFEPEGRELLRRIESVLQQ